MTFWFFLSSTNNFDVEIKFWLAITPQKGQAPKFEKGINLPDSQALAKAHNVFFVLPAALVLLTEIKWPKNLVIEKRTLIFALEDKIVNEPEDVEVEILAKKDDILKVAVVNKLIFASIEKLCKSSSISSYQVTVDVLLTPYEPNKWAIWEIDEAILLRYDNYLGLQLPYGAEETVIRIKLAEAIKKNQNPQNLLICDFNRSRYLQDLVTNWRLPIAINSDIKSPIEYLQNNKIIAINPKKLNFLQLFSNFNKSFRTFLKPLLVIICLLLIIFLLSYFNLQREYAELNQKIEDNFYKVFDRKAVKTSAPQDQIEQQYFNISQKGAGGFVAAFSTMLNNIESVNPPQNIIWQNEVLTAEFDIAPKQLAITNPTNNFVVTIDGKKVIVSKNPLLKN